MGADLTARVELKRASRDRTFSVEVEFTVPPGITILFGPSGSGKTTILEAIAGLVQPDQCRIALGDEIWSDSFRGVHLPPEERRVAYVFQSLALFPHMTAVNNVAYGIPKTASRAERLEKARALLTRLDVAHLADRKPRTFSGGEAQRVALARALALEPRVMLLDEPFSALDRELRIQLAGLVSSLVKELNIPVLQVTHNHGEARAMGDRLVLVRDGRIVAEGPVAELLTRDASLFLEA